jgi:hypothetical protein
VVSRRTTRTTTTIKAAALDDDANVRNNLRSMVLDITPRNRHVNPRCVLITQKNGYGTLGVRRGGKREA